MNRRSGPPMPTSSKARPPPAPRPSAKPSASPHLKDVARPSAVTANRRASQSGPRPHEVSSNPEGVTAKAGQLRPSRAVPSSANVSVASGSAPRPAQKTGHSSSATSVSSSSAVNPPVPSSIRFKDQKSRPALSRPKTPPRKPPRPEFGGKTSSSEMTARNQPKASGSSAHASAMSTQYAPSRSEADAIGVQQRNQPQATPSAHASATGTQNTPSRSQPDAIGAPSQGFAERSTVQSRLTPSSSHSKVQESKAAPAFPTQKPDAIVHESPGASAFPTRRSDTTVPDSKVASASATRKSDATHHSPASTGLASRPKSEESTSKVTSSPPRTGNETKVASNVALRVHPVGEDEVGVLSLIGDYKEAGMNHGKKCHKKIPQDPGKQQMPVFIYFWDERDGVDFSGWWFGESVGGSLVWAKYEGNSQLPPKVGWKVPWNIASAEQKDHIMLELFAPESGKTKQEASSPLASSAAQPHGPAEIVRLAAAKYFSVDKEARQALDQAKRVSDSNTSAQDILAAEEKLQGERVKLLAATKSIDEDTKRATAEGAGLAALQILKNAEKRLRTLQIEMTKEIVRFTSIKKQAEEKKQQQRAELQAKEEERDEMQLQEALSSTLPAIKEAEDAVNSVVTIGSSITIEVEDEISDDMRQLFDEVDDSVKMAQDRLSEARKKISAELNKAKGLTPKVKANAEVEFSALQTRINAVDVKLDPFRRFKLDVQERQQVKKLLNEITVKLSNTELDVEKAHLQTEVGVDGRLSQSDMKFIEELLLPAEHSIGNILLFYEKKLQPFAGGGQLKQELDDFLARHKCCCEKLKGVRDTLIAQRERVVAEGILKKVLTRVEDAEEEMVKSSEAEMPFLKGIEDLPAEEAASAIKECEVAAEKVQHAIALAKNFLWSKKLELRKGGKEPARSVLDEFSELQDRVQKVEEKLKQFHNDTEQRKLKALLQQITEEVVEAEREIEALTKIGGGLSPEDLDQVSLQQLTTSCEKMAVAEKQASAKVLAAWKNLNVKLKACKDRSLLQELQKLEARLNTTQQLQAKARLAASDGQICKSNKQLLKSLDGPLLSKEADLEEMRTSVQSWKEKLPTEDEIVQIESMAQEIRGVHDEATRTIDQQLAAAASSTTCVRATSALKRALEKRRKQIAEVSEEIQRFRFSAEMQRQRRACQGFVAEAERKAEAVESAMVRVSKAELPWFKGIEVLPVEEAEASLLESEKAQDLAKNALDEARSYISAKCTEIGNMLDTSMGALGAHCDEMTSALKRFQDLAAKLDTAGEKHRSFCIETEARKRLTLMQKVNDNMSCLESEVEKLRGMLEDFDKAESVSMEKAGQVCQDVAQFENRVEGSVEEVRDILTEARKFLKGFPDSEPTMNKFYKRHRSAQIEFAKAKIALRAKEKSFVCSKLRLDAMNMLRDLESAMAEVKKLAEPLLHDRGVAFVLDEHVRSVGSALKEHLRSEGRSQEAIFEDLVGEKDDKRIVREAFLSYLEALPEKCEGTDLSFSEAQRHAVFDHLDADKDGFLSSDEFEQIFRERFVCVHGIVVTDQFDIKGGKSLTKLEVDDVVETCKDAQVNAFGLTRIECTLVKSGTKGWVTMKGNQGTPYLEPFVPYESCVKSVEKLMESTSKRFTQTGHLVKSKTKQLMNYSEDPLSDARNELLKVRSQVTDLQDTLLQKQSDLAQAKKDFFHRMEEESRLQKRAGTQRAANSILDLLRASGCALEESLQKLRDAAKPLMSSCIDRAALEAPVSVMEAAERARALVMQEMDAMSSLLKDHSNINIEAPDSPMMAVKVEMTKMMLSLEKAVETKRDVMGELHRTVTSLVRRLLKEATKAFRKDIVQRGLNVDALFSELSAQQRYISEDAFCKHLMTLAGHLPLEHWRLLFRHIEAGGISLHRFRYAFQQYNLCVRGIAITSEFEIGRGSEGRTLRMLDEGELVEVLDGPDSDNHLNIPRIRAAALRDGLQGWISVQGNQGTAFLRETEKPYYLCTAAMSLDKSFKGGDAEEPVRKVMPDEAFELLEGPRAEKACDVFRARGKTTKGSAVGWFTVRTQDGEIFAEQSDKYWICTKPIAMTDARDIKSSTALRKLELGEVCFLLEGPTIEQNAAHLTRIRCRSLRDEQIGWITVRGNAGTTFAEQSTKHYRILREVPLQATFHSRKPERIRVLAVDEVVEVVEGPHCEKFDEWVRIKGRFWTDGAEGWVTKRDGNLKAWSPWYSCAQSASIHDEMTSGKMLRKVNVGEKFQVFKGPQLDEQGALQARVRAEEDGIEGWIIIRDRYSKVFFTVPNGQH